MGVSCGILDDSFDDLYTEAKSYYEYKKVFDFKYLTLEEIDKQLIKIENYKNKYSKIKTSNFKKLNKMIYVGSYLGDKAIELRKAKREKLFDLECQKKEEEYNEWKKNLHKKEMIQHQKLTLHFLKIFSNLKILTNENRDNYIPPKNFGYISYVPKKMTDGKWVEAYHGTGRNCKNDFEIKDMIQSIWKNGFKNGSINAHANCMDINHPRKRVNVGVYVTPNLETAKEFAGTINFEGEEYKTIFLVKIKEDAIRQCNCPEALDYWVVNGSPDEIVPLKILYTKV